MFRLSIIIFYQILLLNLILKKNDKNISFQNVCHSRLYIFGPDHLSHWSILKIGTIFGSFRNGMNFFFDKWSICTWDRHSIIMCTHEWPFKLNTRKEDRHNCGKFLFVYELHVSKTQLHYILHLLLHCLVYAPQTNP